MLKTITIILALTGLIAYAIGMGMTKHPGIDVGRLLFLIALFIRLWF